MFSSEQDALNYINKNKWLLLSQLEVMQIQTIYSNESTKINVMKDGKRLLKIVNRFEGNKKLLDIYKDMIDLKLL